MQLLSLFPNVAAAQVFELIKDHLEPTGSDKAAEERGMYFGKLFALLALMKSGRVTNEVSKSHTMNFVCIVIDKSTMYSSTSIRFSHILSRVICLYLEAMHSLPMTSFSFKHLATM